MDLFEKLDIPYYETFFSFIDEYFFFCYDLLDQNTYYFHDNKMNSVIA